MNTFFCIVNTSFKHRIHWAALPGAPLCSTARKLPVAGVACSALKTGWSQSPSAPATVTSHQIRAGAARAQPAGRARPKSQNIPKLRYVDCVY